MFSNMHIQTYLCRMYAKIGQRMTDDVHLKKVFSNPDMVREAKVFEGMLKGLTIQPAESYDNKFSDDVKLFSYCIPNDKINESSVSKLQIVLKSKLF